MSYSTTPLLAQTHAHTQDTQLQMPTHSFTYTIRILVQQGLLLVTICALRTTWNEAEVEDSERKGVFLLMEDSPPEPRADGPCCCCTSGLMPREQQQQCSVKGYEVGDRRTRAWVCAVCDAWFRGSVDCVSHRETTQIKGTSVSVALLCVFAKDPFLTVPYVCNMCRECHLCSMCRECHMCSMCRLCSMCCVCHV